MRAHLTSQNDAGMNLLFYDWNSSAKAHQSGENQNVSRSGKRKTKTNFFPQSITQPSFASETEPSSNLPRRTSGESDEKIETLSFSGLNEMGSKSRNESSDSECSNSSTTQPLVKLSPRGKDL